MTREVIHQSSPREVQGESIWSPPKPQNPVHLINFKNILDLNISDINHSGSSSDASADTVDAHVIGETPLVVAIFLGEAGIFAP